MRVRHTQDYRLLRHVAAPVLRLGRGRQVSAEPMLLTVGHLLCHVKQQPPVAFVDAAQQPPKHGQKAGLLPGAAPGNFFRRLAFRQIGQIGRFFAVVKKLVHGYFEGAGHFLQRFYGRNRMAIFHARDVAPQQSGTLFYITLRKILFLAQGAKSITNYHLYIVPYGYDAGKRYVYEAAWNTL